MVENVDQLPLAGVVVTVDGYQAITEDDGSFVIEVPEGSVLNDDKLFILGGDLAGDLTYPSIAEPLGLLLGHDAYAGVNNLTFPAKCLNPHQIEHLAHILNIR